MTSNLFCFKKRLNHAAFLFLKVQGLTHICWRPKKQRPLPIETVPGRKNTRVTWLCTKLVLNGLIKLAMSNFYMDIKQKTLCKCYVQHILKTNCLRRKNILHLFCFKFCVFNLIVEKKLYSNVKAYFGFVPTYILTKALVFLCTKLYWNKALVWLCTIFCFLQRLCTKLKVQNV